MKRKSIYTFIACLISGIIVFMACTKEEENVRLDPKLSTSLVKNLTSDSAIVVGFVIAGGDGFTEKGVCYGTSALPTISSNKVIFNKAAEGATYDVKLTGLTRLTTYYARSYATNTSGTIYGDEIEFSTPAALPTIANIVVPTLAITADKGVTATTAINITDDGGPHATANITERGVVFGFSPNPALDSVKSKLEANKTFKTTEGTGKGEFTSLATNLKGNKTYYFRAYATNKIGTRFSNEVTFTTAIALSTISGKAATSVTKTTATFNAKYTYDGGGNVSEKGFVYGTAENPTLANATKVTVTMAADSTLTYNATGLDLYTKYYVRAFATNEAGTNYSDNIQFTTLANTITWYVPGDYVAASYPGSGWANWAPDKSPQVKSPISDPYNVEGYIYMEGASNNWKFASQPNWDGPNYGEGATAGTLSATGGNINLPAGYYKINVDASKDPMTYKAIATAWGVIGDATPGGWGDETALTYNPTLKKWIGGYHFTAAAFKFRANHSWDYNYGSNDADGKLQAGGSNIAVAAEDDYAITLDLSKPNEYTYSINAWGLIGDATGSWGTDKNMTWDATNKVFKITTDLVVGAMKFRANDDWTVNLGGALDALTQGGDNIAVATAGNYTITLDPWLGKATVTKN